jgi:hypothetical protein
METYVYGFSSLHFFRFLPFGFTVLVPCLGLYVLVHVLSGWSLMWTSGIFGPSRIPITASGGQKKSKGD